MEVKVNLEKTIDDLGVKVRKSEQNLEHWKLEFQLLQMKYEKSRNGENSEGGTSETDQEKILSEIEEDLKRPYKGRIDELVSERMLADSKATAFYLEGRALKRRFRAAERRKEKLTKELQIASEQIEILRSEVGNTASTYEGQLSLMSEHVANMNEKLTEQTDTIAGLRYELTNKGKKAKK